MSVEREKRLVLGAAAALASASVLFAAIARLRQAAKHSSAAAAAVAAHQADAPSAENALESYWRALVAELYPDSGECAAATAALLGGAREVELDIDEIEALLSRRPSREAAAASASRRFGRRLAVLWLRQRVRQMEAALHSRHSVPDADEAAESINEHCNTFERMFALRERNDDDDDGCGARWQELLTVALPALRRARAAEQRQNFAAFARHVFGLRGAIATSVALTAALTAALTRLGASGSVLRRAIEAELVEENGSSGGAGVLLACEVARLATQLALRALLDGSIRRAGAARRESTKLRLYRALARTPLEFFDLHSTDDIEEIVFFVNDLEGVEVRLWHFLAEFVQAFGALRNAAAGWPPAAVGAAFAVAAALHCATAVSERVLRWLRAAATSEQQRRRHEDAEEVENGTSGADGFLLTGLDIFARVHALRPHGADRRLVRAWCTEMARAGFGGGESFFAGSPASVAVAAAVAVARGATTCLQWAGPLAAAAALRQQHDGSLSAARDVFSAADGVLRCALDSAGVAELLAANAHKAGTLRRVLANASDAAVNWEAGNSSDDDENDENARVVSIRLRGVSFAYNRRHRCALRDATLELPVGGRLVCLAGASGAGKSTLAALLLRLYRPSAGTIELEFASRDSVTVRDLQDVPPRALRTSLFAYVPQTPVIFAGGSVAQNVTLLPRVSLLADAAVLRRVRACLALARCAEFVDALPEGAMTRIAGVASSSAADVASAAASSGGAGIRLSGGQAQRLMLARALYFANVGREPAASLSHVAAAVLLLDEPTASLPRDAREAMAADLRGLVKDGVVAGVLCITHDDTLLAAADAVVQMPVAGAS